MFRIGGDDLTTEENSRLNYEKHEKARREEEGHNIQLSTFDIQHSSGPDLTIEGREGRGRPRSEVRCPRSEDILKRGQFHKSIF